MQIYMRKLAEDSPQAQAVARVRAAAEGMLVMGVLHQADGAAVTVAPTAQEMAAMSPALRQSLIMQAATTMLAMLVAECDSPEESVGRVTRAYTAAMEMCAAVAEQDRERRRDAN